MKTLIFYYISGDCVKIKWTWQARLRRKGYRAYGQTWKPHDSSLRQPWREERPNPSELSSDKPPFPTHTNKLNYGKLPNLELVYGTWRGRVYWAVLSIINFYQLQYFLFFIINIVVTDCYVLVLCHQGLHRFLRRLFSGKNIYFNALSFNIEKEISNLNLKQPT